MKTATGPAVIHNGQLADGTGSPPVKDAAVLIRDGLIAYAGPVAGAPIIPPEAERIDAKGGTILPGLVEAHYHPTYFDVAALEDLDIKYPVEYVTLLAAANARLAADGELRVEIAQVFPLADAASAHEVSEGGHVRGKLVLLP